MTYNIVNTGSFHIFKNFFAILFVLVLCCQPYYSFVFLLFSNLLETYFDFCQILKSTAFSSTPWRQNLWMYPRGLLLLCINCVTWMNVLDFIILVWSHCHNSACWVLIVLSIWVSIYWMMYFKIIVFISLCSHKFL